MSPLMRASVALRRDSSCSKRAALVMDGGEHSAAVQAVTAVASVGAEPSPILSSTVVFSPDPSSERAEPSASFSAVVCFPDPLSVGAEPSASAPAVG